MHLPCQCTIMITYIEKENSNIGLIALQYLQKFSKLLTRPRLPTCSSSINNILQHQKQEVKKVLFEFWSTCITTANCQ